MFDFSTFIFDGVMDGISRGESRFVITERAGAWMTRGVLSPDQMSLIAAALDERDSHVEQEEAPEM